ncbi:MAG: SPOR domain-containing protein [Candidatus Omnitrophica bacterium]|nr:SPOR domain-containing protein [Candidatus Omnitrophota bacterium]
MEEEKYQKKLFEFEQPKRSFSRLSDMLPKADFEGRVAITISLEKLVFISIGIMMVMVVVYALGVESGKSRADTTGAQVTKPLPSPPVSQAQQNRPATIPAKNILNTAPIVPAAKNMAPARQIIQEQAKTAAIGKASKPFTILAGTFTKRENAEAACAVLARQGLNAAVTYSQFYYRVCVGIYANSAEAERDLARVKSIYKDAMLKPR